MTTDQIPTNNDIHAMYQLVTQYGGDKAQIVDAGTDSEAIRLNSLLIYWSAAGTEPCWCYRIDPDGDGDTIDTADEVRRLVSRNLQEVDVPEGWHVYEDEGQWYYEPLGYDGDVTYSPGFSRRRDALEDLQHTAEDQ